MKAVLVIDEMPTACDNCKLESEMLNCGKPMCVGTPYRRERIEDDSTKPSWCPLRPLPKKLNETEIVFGEIHGYRGGWNDCLDEITGETE